MDNLALTYRPRHLDDLVGQRPVQVILSQMIATRRVPPAMLFAGVRGTGKTTSARVLAAALNCDNPPGPCNRCVPCKAVFDGSSLDVIEIDAASNGLVDDIRDLRQQLLYRMSGDYRIIIFDEAHSASGAAFNALLKTIEEPPPGARFILCTTEARRLPDTILSRAMPFHFRRISPADITGRLAHIARTEQIPAEASLLAAIAARADGGMRDAIMMLDQVSRAGITTAAGLDDVFGTDDDGPAILDALARGDRATAYTLADAALHAAGQPAHVAASLTRTLKHILVLQSQDTATPADDPAGSLASRLGVHDTVAAMRVLWDLKTKTRLGDDARANLDLAIAMIGEALCPARSPASPTAATPPRLSLAEMMRQK